MHFLGLIDVDPHLGRLSTERVVINTTQLLVLIRNCSASLISHFYNTLSTLVFNGHSSIFYNGISQDFVMYALFIHLGITHMETF